MTNPTQFPSDHDKIRLQRYEHFDRLYYGNHYEAYAIRGEEGFSTQYSKLRYVVANFAGLMSRVMADMLFGENIVIDLQDQKSQEFIDGVIEENNFITQLYESALVASRKGEAVFKIRIGKRHPLDTTADDEIIIEEISPNTYFPVFDSEGSRNTPVKDQIITEFEQGEKTYLHKEIHEPFLITHEVYEYDKKREKVVAQVSPEDFGFPQAEDTKVNRSLVVYIPNVRDGRGFWGTSDYQDLDQLFFALNNRITKIDNILDKHSDPILAVPPGVLDDEGHVRKEALGMFQVDNDSPGFNKPEYIVWNANLDSAFSEVQKLMDMLFMFSEIAPATMGMDSNGAAESGRALKFRLLATLRKRSRKMQYFEQAIKDIVELVLELSLAHNIKIDGQGAGKVERPNVIWGDGVINDDVELTEIAQMRIDSGLSSPADEISRLDGISLDDAKKKAEEIDEAQTPRIPEVQNNLITTPPVDESIGA